MGGIEVAFEHALKVVMMWGNSHWQHSKTPGGIGASRAWTQVMLM
jgi:hypothetical protein